jgi:putative transposase
MLGSSQQEESMKPSQHTTEQIIKILDQAEKGEQTVGSVYREHGITKTTFYRWRHAYGGMSVSEAQRLKELEKENGRLKRLLPIGSWRLTCSRSFWGKKSDRDAAARSGRLPGDGQAVRPPCLPDRRYPSLHLPL